MAALRAAASGGQDWIERQFKVRASGSTIGTSGEVGSVWSAAAGTVVSAVSAANSPWRIVRPVSGLALSVAIALPWWLLGATLLVLVQSVQSQNLARIEGAQVQLITRGGHDWAAKMARTHKQERCSGCGLFQIWVPRAKSSTQENTI